MGMAFDEYVECESSTGVIVWKFPGNNLSTETKLLVRESQEAIFLGKGHVIGHLGPGEHILNIEKLPLLHDLYGISSNENALFKAEVWFVNKSETVDIDWITLPIKITDPYYGQKIPIFAQGKCYLKINDAELFLLKSGFKTKKFDLDGFKKYVLKPLSKKISNSLISYINVNKIGISKIVTYIDSISSFIEVPVKEFWEEYGMELMEFNISSMGLDTSTLEGKKIAAFLNNRSANKASNINSEIVNPQKSYPALQNAECEHKGNNKFLGTRNNNIKKDVYCSNCSRKYPRTSNFCPYCGKPYDPCPVCGNDNDPRATQCAVCGTVLVPMDAQTLVESNCPSCNFPIKNGQKFCPNCGIKIN